MMPIIAIDLEPFVVLYGDLPKAYKIQLISDNIKHISIYHKKNIPLFLYRFLNRIIKGKLNKKILTIYDNFLVNSIKKELIKINKMPLKSCSNIFFDHTSSRIASLIVSELTKYRYKNNLHYQLVSIPHGVGTIINSMCDYPITAPVILSGYDMYDKIICNDMQHFDTFIDSGINDSKLVQIKSLRYTKVWVDKLLKKSNVLKNDNNKINILVIHTKFIGNINSKEVERCIRILSKFDMFNIKIKSHPRGGLKEAVKLAKNFKKVEIATDDIVGNIFWCDYVLFFGSSVVYDAFIQNKPVIFPSYATSNLITNEILNNVICLRTPDDYYQTIYEISRGNNPSIEDRYQHSYKDILKSWKELLD